MKYFIKTFGCQQNKADSERIGAIFKNKGFSETNTYKDANYVIVNTCMVRHSAEERVYGLIQNVAELKKKRKKDNFMKIIVTGCMVGLAFRDATGKYLNKIKTRMPGVDEFMPIEEVGFDTMPHRMDAESAWVPISNGCNNFCTFCIVPFTRGREISRPYNDIISECKRLKQEGYKKVTLLGQNVNSYGADLILGKENVQVMRDLPKTYFQKQEQEQKAEVKNEDTLFRSSRLGDPSGEAREKNEYRGSKKITHIQHLGRYRIPTLFPHLLEEIAEMGFETVDFFSSNPWDFTDELIEVIGKHKNISRTIHLPVQSGDDQVLHRMNRWYTSTEYLKVVKRLRAAVPDLKLTTDIIVGFCGETDKEFQSTVNLSKQAQFEKAYISIYSERPMTAATKILNDDVPHAIKKSRWLALEELINKPHLKRRIVS